MPTMVMVGNWPLAIAGPFPAPPPCEMKPTGAFAKATHASGHRNLRYGQTLTQQSPAPCQARECEPLHEQQREHQPKPQRQRQRKDRADSFCDGSTCQRAGRSEAKPVAGVENRAELDDDEWDDLHHQIEQRIRSGVALLRCDGKAFDDCHWEGPRSAAESPAKNEVLGFWTTLMQCVPNLRVCLHRLEFDGFTAVKYLWICGTQTNPLLPMFPVNDFFRALLCVTALNDRSGKLIQDETRISFEVQLGVTPNMLEWLLQCARELMADKSGSRTLQEAVEAAQNKDQLAFVQGFRRCVWQASSNPHANFFLQACIVNLPPSQIHFVAEEFKGRAVEAAKHAIRSRVLERLLEHCPAEDIDDLVMELVSSGVPLSRHAFGNFVMQRVLEYGTDAQRSALVLVLRGAAVELARHRNASNVVRCALVSGSLRDRRDLASILTRNPDVARSIDQAGPGSFVMRAVKELRRREGLTPSVVEVSL
eukprot:CAMPEP_0198572686 /NCGR_PEP_ID=MMETSP1462-20131121/112155_1 /TAXON_ID=1333877 /ORGANISM="Brandtodinium nutriculum, Strain RCC3387" /LENGTH=478 /DNA_ID=CAMNT_0044303849 /DNA_START=12 /DNA_END=1448 /DNA_ORIENTATION=+